MNNIETVFWYLSEAPSGVFYDGTLSRLHDNIVKWICDSSIPTEQKVMD